jgi:MFS family permease
MSLGAFVFGTLDRVLGHRKLLVVVGSLLTAAGFLTLALLPQPAVSSAILVMAFIGFMGLHQPLVFAHARSLFPEHLLGRGMTFANFLTIGGAGVVQWASGSFVSHLQASGTAAPELYAALHLTFGIVVAGATLIYLPSTTPDRSHGAQ